jgi:hypothetical protein
MSEEAIATIGFLVLAMIEAFNGLRLAFRTRRTLGAAGLVHTDGPGLLVQEFGVYSLGIAGAYVVAAWDPIRFGGVGVAGIAINVCAAAMHLLRSAGLYFGDARPVLGRAFERKAGLVHAFALLVLLLSQYQPGSVA